MNTLRKIAIHLDEHEARCFAIPLRYKSEKLIPKRLDAQDISTYLPIQQFDKTQGDTLHLQVDPTILKQVFDTRKRAFLVWIEHKERKTPNNQIGIYLPRPLGQLSNKINIHAKCQLGWTPNLWPLWKNGVSG